MPKTKYLARDLACAVRIVGSTEVDVVGSVQPLTTPFGVAATDTLTLTAHALLDGDQIRFSSLTGGAGLTVGPDYYVRDKTTNTFKVSASFLGAPVNFTSDISAGGITKITPAWTRVGGLESLTPSPSTERADTTGFDERGRPSHLVVQRGDSWELAGFALVDLATAAKDPGQLMIENSCDLFGVAAELVYRISDPANNRLIFNGTAELTRPGGAHNDAATWSASVEMTGEPLKIPGP